MRERRGGSFLLQIPLLMSLLAANSLAPSSLHAEESSVENISCAQFLEREFREVGQIHDYKIWMEPGETMILRVVPMGSTLLIRTYVYEPANQVVKESGYQHEVRMETPKLSARGTHTIRVINTRYIGDDEGRVGVYTLDVSCKRNDGSYVEAGAQGRGPAPSPATASQGAAAAPLQAASSLTDAAAGMQSLGKYAGEIQKLQSTVGAAQQAVQLISGVADLAKGLWKKKKGAQEAAVVAAPTYQKPEDMMAKGQQLAYAQPVETPAPFAPKPVAAPAEPPPAVDRQTFPSLGLGTLLQGEVTASSGAQGCRFQAKAGQGVDLKFERLTGNQGLMVTVFGPDQQPIFLSSVLASPKLATTLQLPVAGEYVVEIAAAGPVGGPARFSLQLAAASK